MGSTVVSITTATQKATLSSFVLLSCSCVCIGYKTVLVVMQKESELKPPPTEPLIGCLRVTTVWTLIGLVLFIPGFAIVVLKIGVLLVKFFIQQYEEIQAQKIGDPIPESEPVDMPDLILTVLLGGILMAVGYCVLSGLHGPVVVRRPLYVLISIGIFFMYGVLGFACAIIHQVYFHIWSSTGLLKCWLPSCSGYYEYNEYKEPVDFNYFRLIISYVASIASVFCSVKLLLYHRFMQRTEKRISILEEINY